MAKEFTMKLQIDTSGAVKEVNGTIDTIAGFEKQLGSLQDKLNNTKIGTDEYKKLQKEYDRTAKAAENVKNANKGWLDSIASAPGAVGFLGQSIQGVQKAFGNFNMALKTSLIGFIAAAVIELINQFKKMEGVMDPINKITSIFSGLMSQLATTVLPLVIAPLELLAKGLEKVGNLFGGAGSELADLADRQDALTDSTADYELEQSKANRALQEAREKAADSTLTIKERKQALQDAEKLERDIAAKGKERSLEQARITAGQLGATLKLKGQELENIKKMDAAQLESFAKRIAQEKGLNQEQRKTLLQQLQNIEDIDASTAKIGKKTAAGLKQLDTEEEQRRKEARDKAIQAAKERQQKELDNAKQGIDALIELEKGKANTSETVLRDLLEKKDALNNKDLMKEKEALEKKGKAQTDADKKRIADINNVLEVQRVAREKAIKTELKTDKDEVAKNEDDKIKIIKQAAANELNEKTALLESIKIKDGEKSESFKKAQLEIYAIQDKAIKDEVAALNKKTELTEADKQRLKDLGVEAIKLANTIATGEKAQIDAQVQKQEAQRKLDADMLQYKFEQAEGDFEAQRQILAQQQELDKKAYDDALKAAGDDKIKRGEIEQNWVKKKGEYSKKAQDIDNKEFEAKVKLAQGIASVMSSLADIVGKDTVAGKALAVAASLINTYAAIAAQLKTAAGSPGAAVPGWAIAQAIATGLVGFKAVRDILKVEVPQNQDNNSNLQVRKMAIGGVLKGPSHAMGGIMTAFGELEGGEYVVNKTATQMFRPQLDAINGMGGRVEYQPANFAGAVQSSEPPIFKTYVVASEMSSQQEIDRIIKSRSKM